MDQDLANEKINKWGMLLLLEVPNEMHFGKNFLIFYNKSLNCRNLIRHR